MKSLRPISCASVVAGLLGTASARAMTINLVPDAGLSANPAALASFNRAAQTWDNLFTDPITVTIDAGLDNLGSTTIIGQTGSSTVNVAYSSVRTQLIADAKSTADLTVAALLPATLTATLPAGRTLSGNLTFTTANAKALGYTVNLNGNPDAQITFNSGFSFTYNNATGVAAGTEDFQTVATHEIGHALGFDSVVDTIDTNSATAYPSVSPSVLDLFRFAGSSAVSATTFSTGPRDLVPGDASVTSDTSVAYAMSTGINGGDGHQASHWKDDNSPNGGPLNANYIGIMDPTLGTGTVEPVTAADIKAFDLIGYDVAVPEPTALGLIALGLPLILRRRSRAAR